MSYKLKEVTKGSCFSKRDRGCPIPPPAPRTATFVNREADVENKRDEEERDLAAVRESIFLGKEMVVVEKEGQERRGCPDVYQRFPHVDIDPFRHPASQQV